MSKETELSEFDLREVERRVAAATPGPWVAHVEGRDFDSGSDCITTAADDIEMLGATEADYDFIAHARQDIPRLLEEVRRLKRALEQGAGGKWGEPTE